MADIANNEKIYDEEIAPALLAIGKRCEELGLPFLAVAEWAPGEIGRTETSPAGVCLGFRIIQYAARSTPNFDSLAINLIRYCRAQPAASPAPVVAREPLTVDDLAQEIRRVDGAHSLGAGALAEALIPWLRARCLTSKEGDTKC